MERPRLAQQLSQRAAQELQLAPRLLQSIEVLQIPAHDLERYLREAFESNEALCLGERAPSGRPAEARARPGVAAGARGSRSARSSGSALLEQARAPGPGLVEEVHEQLAWMALAPEREAWARFLVGELDERGLLCAGDDALLERAERLGLAGGRAALAGALALLQELEPRGLGARSPVEALLLQLDPRDPDYRLLARLIEELLDEVARNKLPSVARALGVACSEAERLVKRLRALSPAPAAAATAARGATAPLVPEVVVEPTEAGFELYLERSGLPAVEIDARIARLAADRAQPRELRRYLRGRIDQARMLIQALEQRSATLQAVARATFARQSAFLRDGPGHLVPLRMGEIADELGLHLSTVSRAVSGKHVQTPWGILALRHFFQAAVGGSTERARVDARALVRALVESEDQRRPLSDEELVEHLLAQGVDVARRTVAKYRGELGIPSSYQRRRYG